MSFDFSTLLVGLIASSIGFAAWQYGRRRSSARHMIIGLLLMGEGWVLPDARAGGAVAVALTIFLFWPKVQ
jgi:hypothetical protein